MYISQMCMYIPLMCMYISLVVVLKFSQVNWFFTCTVHTCTCMYFNITILCDDVQRYVCEFLSSVKLKEDLSQFELIDI